MLRKVFFTILSVLTFVLRAQIVADHRVVELYGEIPKNWIDTVKSMLVDLPGLSHQAGYSKGLNLLESLDATYQVSTYYIDVINPTSNYLRFGKHLNSEEEFWTNSTTISAMKTFLTDQYNAINPVHVFGFGWCWDMHWMNAPGGTIDPVYKVRWAGASVGGPDGNRRWGLDEDDNVLTGNSINMDTYLAAIEEYINHVNTNGYPTKVIFTTGPVDNYLNDVDSTENGLQREYKHDYIRAHVNSDQSYILFDYADILCHNNEGEKHFSQWNGIDYAHMHPDNMMDYDASFNIVSYSEDGDHIGDVGALRLGKAIWWLLARIAGWYGTVDGEDTTPPSVPTGLSTSFTSIDAVTLSWNASSDNVAVTSYNVYRNGTLLGSTSELSYTDNTLTECNEYTYSVSAFDAAGNESEQSQGLDVSNCHPDLTPTLIVTPNISHGITTFYVIVRVTELNNVNTDGQITVNIPADVRWDLDEGYNTSLEVLNETALNNSDWTYSRDETNHIFSSSVVIQAGGFSTLGFTIVFNPDTSRGLYTVTSQLVSGSGGEIRSSNNADSERLDYFQ
jgi:chitodextrinase